MNIPENILSTLTDEHLSRLSGGGFWKTCNDNKHDSIIR